MGHDIFSFWEEVTGEKTMHPQDRWVLESAAHGFRLDCLPANFDGPLRTARVVLLYLSPGWDKRDSEEAKCPEAQQRYERRRKGFSPLSGPEDHNRGYEWWTSRTKCFGTPEELQEKVAVLNIGAYHSERFHDHSMLAALPSSRVCLDWAQRVLFPQAEEGKRVVVCLRAARYWGLGKKHRYGKWLFSPKVTRGGHLQGKSGEESTPDHSEEEVTRTDVISAVKKALSMPPLDF